MYVITVEIRDTNRPGAQQWTKDRIVRQIEAVRTEVGLSTDIHLLVSNYINEKADR